MMSDGHFAVSSNTNTAVAPRTRRHRQTEEHEALDLLPDLDSLDIEWILSSSTEQQVNAGSTLVAEGHVPDALYFVLEGLLEMRSEMLGGRTLARIGPGEIVGEMSFLEDRPATATVRVSHTSLLLVLPRKALAEKTAADTAFSARLYRSFARGLSRRLHVAHGVVPHPTVARTELDQTGAECLKEINTRLDAMKRLLVEADRLAIRNDDLVPDATAAKIQEQFQGFCGWLNEQIGDDSVLAPEMRQELGARVQQEILPYMLMSKNGERWYAKPRGYAGDFLSIEWMYQDRAEGTGRLGPVLDRCFLDVPAAQAVRNRRGLLVDEIRKTMEETQEGPTRILSMACGPAREIFDTYATLPDPSQLKATCLDIDLQALAFVADLRDRRKLKSHIRLENANLVYLATGRQKLELPSLDLAYSIGLIDYFADDFVVKMLNFVHDHLRPGGRVILGNFHPRNQTKAFMDHVLEWKLIHRDEADMNRLFEASKFGRPCEELRYENEGINLFAIGRRAYHS